MTAAHRSPGPLASCLRVNVWPRTNQGAGIPLPEWLAKFNKRVFNPIEIRRGARPVLTHVGRTSGKLHQTPLDAHPVPGGWIFIVMYGPDSDWVQNVLAAGSAALQVGGRKVDLVNPELFHGPEAQRLLAASAKLPAAFLRVDYFLRVDQVT